MRLRMVTPALAVLLLSGCAGTGSGTSASASASASPAAPWLIYNSGNPSPSATPALSLNPSATALPWTPLPSASTCAIDWPNDEQVLIPMIVTPGVGSLTVQWPSAYGPNYRLTAVNQKLVTGAQPTPTWINVTAGAGCTVTATLTGLITGNPYVVWLDAPNTPRHLDNSRSLYSGRSAVVKPL
jgi:hypothetical protein